MRALLSSWGDVAVETDPDANAATWAAVRDARAPAGGEGDLWRVSVAPGKGPAVIAEATRAAGHAGANGDDAALMDWGGGLVWLRMPPGTDLRSAIGALGGHATLVRASAETRARLGVFHPEPAPLARIAARLRAEFDPSGVLNPGRMGRGPAN